MSIVDELVENLVERNAIDLNGSFTIAVTDGGVRLTGQLHATVRDEKKRKEILKVDAPLDAQVTVAPIVIPLPQIK
jgi:hypothetical protein